MDDDELITAIAGGDDTALRELFARHAPWLAARLRSMLPAAEVEDVLQESFLAVWRVMYLEDRTVSEVAGLMGVPEGTVKSRAHRVRQLMRAVLRPVADGGGR